MEKLIRFTLRSLTRVAIEGIPASPLRKSKRRSSEPVRHSGSRFSIGGGATESRSWDSGAAPPSVIEAGEFLPDRFAQRAHGDVVIVHRTQVVGARFGVRAEAFEQLLGFTDSQVEVADGEHEERTTRLASLLGGSDRLARLHHFGIGASNVEL